MRAIGRGSIVSFLTILLNAAWLLAALGLVLSAGLLVISPFDKGPVEVSAGWLGAGSTMTIPVAFRVDHQAHRITAPSLGLEDAQIEDARGLLRFPARRSAFLVANLIFLIVMFAIGLWVIGQLRAVFRTLRDGHPFVRANARRIRAIGYAVIIGEIARSAIVFYENYYAMTHFAADGLRFEARPELNVLAIVGGLIILVIAEVFGAGSRLDEEQALTV
jgi:Protein of unknown function (DUF2975)